MKLCINNVKINSDKQFLHYFEREKEKMKKATKKLLCLLLVFSVLASAFTGLAVVSSAEGVKGVKLSETNYGSDIPIIFIHGQGSPILIPQEDGSVRSDTFDIDTDKIVSALTENPDILIKAFVTQDWTEFDNLIVGIMADIYKDGVLNEDGEVTDGSYTWFGSDKSFCWYKGTPESIADRYDDYDGSLDTFFFEYDWRLDPLEIMGELESFIDSVLEVTGEKQYAICGRCEGACIALQYLDYYKNKYGSFDKRLTDVIFNSSAINGVSPLGEALSGELYVDPEGIERFIYDTDLNVNLPVLGDFVITDTLIRKAITILTDYYGTDLVSWAVNNVYEQIYMNVVPRILRSSYGAWPGYWAMVGNEYYDRAKQTMFAGQEEKYAKFIEKIDRYHNNISLRSEEIIKEAMASGIEISNIVKYGKQVVPVIRDSGAQSDLLCLVKNSSWGATTADVCKAFDKEYMMNAAKSGTSAYISPDKCIDASTCLLPDTTWFIKGMDHFNFPKGMDPLIFEIVNKKNFTVFSSKDFPQYLFYDAENDKTVPYIINNMNTPLDIYRSTVLNSFSKKIKPYFVNVFNALTFVINLLMPKVKS